LNPKSSLLRCDSGAAAIEMAIVVTAFLGMLFGIVNLGLLLWTQTSLHFAVESAARCASVNTTTCGTSDAITTYALNQYAGESLGGTNPFSYSAAGGCGHQVSAAYTYALAIPLYGSYSIPLSAKACFP
jgi:Flp pilus assembly protein TadG